MSERKTTAGWCGQARAVHGKQTRGHDEWDLGTVETNRHDQSRRLILHINTQGMRYALSMHSAYTCADYVPARCVSLQPADGQSGLTWVVSGAGGVVAM